MTQTKPFLTYDRNKLTWISELISAWDHFVHWLNLLHIKGNNTVKQMRSIYGKIGTEFIPNAATHIENALLGLQEAGKATKALNGDYKRLADVLRASDNLLKLGETCLESLGEAIEDLKAELEDISAVGSKAGETGTQDFEALFKEILPGILNPPKEVE
jgi:hypothetical protein